MSNTKETKVAIARLETEVLAVINDILTKRAVKAAIKKFVKNLDGDTIKLVPVKSSTVKAIGYEQLTETLRIEFLSGGIYDYLGVEPGVHEALADAPSVGSFLNARIKPNYGNVKIK